MNIGPPTELQGYRQDPIAGRKVRFVGRLLMWTVIISFVGMPVFGLLRSPVGFLVCFVACVAGSVTSARFFSRKRKRKCPRCRGPMEQVETPWSVSEWDRMAKKTLHAVRGADGNMYRTGHMRSGHGTGPHATGRHLYMVYALRQTWYACDKCRLCYLGIENRAVSVFSNISKERWKEAVEIVKADPNPIEEGRVRISSNN